MNAFRDKYWYNLQEKAELIYQSLVLDLKKKNRMFCQTIKYSTLQPSFVSKREIFCLYCFCLFNNPVNCCHSTK